MSRYESYMRTVPGRPDELAAMSTLIVLSLPVVEWCEPPTVAELDQLRAVLARWRPVVEAFERGRVALAPFVATAARELFENYEQQPPDADGEDREVLDEDCAAVTALLVRLDEAS